MSIEWLAGLLEGEGYFGRNGTRGGPSVHVTMTDCDVVQRAADAYPGGRRLAMRALPSGKTAYTTGWGGRNARALMWELEPYMGERRRERILTVMADYYEDLMACCHQCGSEFSRKAKNQEACSASCRVERRLENQRARRSAV